LPKNCNKSQKKPFAHSKLLFDQAKKKAQSRRDFDYLCIAVNGITGRQSRTKGNEGNRTESRGSGSEGHSEVSIARQVSP